MKGEAIDLDGVLPRGLGRVLRRAEGWFLIGGQAVRCYCPYRQSDDVDLGVANVKALRDLVAHLRRSGKATVRERDEDTIHLRWEGTDISVFVRPRLARFVSSGVLTVQGILATKTHAILDRGTRRDFFDLYVMLERSKLGILEALRAVEDVYEAEVNDDLLLRALTFFDDADREAALVGEGPKDWGTIKDYFRRQVGGLIVPPTKHLAIVRRKAPAR